MAVKGMAERSGVPMRARDDMKVSCLMVTLPVPERFRFLQASVAAYCRQTHANKELIIVADTDAPDAKSAIAAHVASLGRDDIRIVDIPDRLPLGALRNISVASARGDVVCHWDDDDLHHPRRLELQLGALLASGGQPVCLEQVMLYFSASRMLYCTNWHAAPSKSFPASLMCPRSEMIAYPETGPTSRLGEDTAVALQLQSTNGLRVLADAPHLYVYVCHGQNSWAVEHHRMLVDELAISRGLLARREAQLRAELRAYDFGAGALTLQGSNGAAFVIDETAPHGAQNGGSPRR